ncbi:MAG: hypothetical protein ABI183_12765 [Polyangiaceae bacterium]
MNARRVGFSIGFLVMTTAPLAFAGDTAAAQVLFSQGRKLMNERKFSDACPKLEESENLDPGMGTLYNLGDCYEHLGRTASAWAAFDEVATAAKDASEVMRAQDARARASKLLPLLSHLTIDASAVKMLPSLKITRDGSNVGAPEWSVSIPVDPGERTIAASATGKKNWITKIKIAPHDNQIVAIPILEDEPVDVTAPPPQNVHEEPKNDGKTQRTLGLVVAGVGVAALATGVVLTLISKGEESKSNEGDCDAITNVCKTANGVSERSTAQLEGNLATVGILGGLVLAGSGIVLWATAPKAHAAPAVGKWNVVPDVAFDPRGASFGLRGHW